MWKIFWVILFYLTFASFCIISALIAWKGIEDLRQLFSRLKGSREQAPRMHSH
jgi:hypothetical protein